jgi:sulfur carrier protein
MKPSPPPSPAQQIRIYINNELHSVSLGTTLADSIKLSNLTPPFAAAVNMEFVPKGAYEARVLLENDRIELISPITGG